MVGAPPPPEDPPSQSPPSKGTSPRIDARVAGDRAAKLPHVLLGWVGADGFPVAVPVDIDGADSEGITLRTAAPTLPAGSRRAGLTAHWFSRGVIGQRQRKHTGWLTVAEGGTRGRYAPHTDSSYWLPNSKTMFRLASGGGTRLWLRRARREGVAERLTRAT